MTTPDSEILKRIPHRPPMLLVDKILSESESSIVCEKSFHADEFFVQGHYPNQPIVPGVILCECCAQAGALLLGRIVAESDDDSAGKVPVLTRLSDAKFKNMVRPGDTAEIEATLDEQLSGAFFMTAKLKVDGKLAVRVQFACALAPAPE